MSDAQFARGRVARDQVARGQVDTALAAARPVPFWLDQPGVTRPGAEPALAGRAVADLAVVGGGFTGLWTALQAKEADPDRDVVLLEGRRLAWAGTGRNGGFCAASLTHGLANGHDRFPAELAELERLGRDNLDEIERAIGRYQIDCDFVRSGELAVATQPWQADNLREGAALAARLGTGAKLLAADEVRAEVNSPGYLAGLWDTDGCATVDPARLAWGLRRACLEAGVRIHEHTPVLALTGEPGSSPRLVLTTPGGQVSARRVALAAGAFSPLLRRLRYYLLPVYDYVLVTEPLTAGQLASIGWQHRQGVGDSANQFHYYRLTADNRILWGGYDAIYYFGGKVAASKDQRPATFTRLAEHFFATFPQLDGVTFSHKWGGVIDTCSRFCAFFGTARAGRLAYAAGYTGLGVGASRFGARVLLDLLGGEPTGLTELEMVRTKPVPFPPEPVRSAGVQLTRWSLARADERDGRRNLWLRTLDRAGLGFDS
ncbi:MAG TPA: FAD-dependent oxidoreductase [Streptosporangiaceae bacterium]|nr:FAD-dependent oxidoreductase [Streptosporangiaceae bacterium]